MNIPLTTQLRPKTIDEIIGQDHLLGQAKPLRRMVEKNRFRSTILWGPPGIGKTSLILAMANDAKIFCHKLSATTSTKELRQILDSCQPGTLVFVDELHRWSKAQQDILLPVVENETIILFAATTENPKFAINSTLLSRCMVFELKPLSPKSMIELLLKVKQHYATKQRTIKIPSDAAKRLIAKCSGDARKLTMALETIVELFLDFDTITVEHVDAAVPTKHIVFDARGNDHFDLAHCYQEAIQNSDVNSAIYWLAKWIESGEDPVYICRRMLITAFEDCAGNPSAWLAAMAAAFTAERTGLPECMIPMSLATCEMGTSVRNKSAYHAIKAALSDVRNGVTIHVPEELRAGTNGYIKITSKQYLKGWSRDKQAPKPPPKVSIAEKAREKPPEKPRNRRDFAPKSQSRYHNIMKKADPIDRENIQDNFDRIKNSPNVKMYAIGRSDDGKEFGMFDGPNPKLDEMLNKSGDEDMYIIEFHQMGDNIIDKPIFRWIDDIYRWQPL